MVYAMRNQFKNIYSIELSYFLWNFCNKRFKNEPHVVILHGDSGKILFKLIPQIKERAIFFLDGHYSKGDTAQGEKDCPIFEELRAIFLSNINHVLIIDDANCFDGSNDYPSIPDLEKYIMENRKLSEFEVRDNMIRVVLSKCA